MKTITSWKTTLIGALLAIVIAVQPLIATGKIDWKAVIIAALIAGLGYVAKDSDVTGGTRKFGSRVIKFLMVAVFLTGLSTTTNAQVKFLKPVPSDLFKTEAGNLKAVVNPSVWLFRPSATITAIAMTWNKETKQFDSAPLSSFGPGVSYSHFIESDNLPYNNYSFNAFLLLGTDIEHITPASISLAGTVSFMQFMSIGGGYNFGSKTPFILTGIVIKL